MHLEKCNYPCPNRASCYFIKRNQHEGEIDAVRVRNKVLCSGYKVYESVCQLTEKDYRITLLKSLKNYSITLSYLWFLKPKFRSALIRIPKEQLQVSIYNLEQSQDLPSLQKLFLIKDTESFNEFTMIVSKGIENIHFNIDTEWISKEKLEELLTWTKSFKSNVSFDSCLTSWLVNGECPYKKDYIDISYDGTLRKCPFKKDNIGNLSQIRIEDAFLIDSKCDCVYKTIFGGQK